jgi:hypothetical protein
VTVEHGSDIGQQIPGGLGVVGWSVVIVRPVRFMVSMARVMTV